MQHQLLEVYRYKRYALHNSDTEAGKRYVLVSALLASAMIPLTVSSVCDMKKWFYCRGLFWTTDRER